MNTLVGNNWRDESRLSNNTESKYAAACCGSNQTSHQSNFVSLQLLVVINVDKSSPPPHHLPLSPFWNWACVSVGISYLGDQTSHWISNKGGVESPVYEPRVFRWYFSRSLAACFSSLAISDLWKFTMGMYESANYFSVLSSIKYEEGSKTRQSYT